MGAICLSPTGNNQGSHWFMSLATSACITCHHWMCQSMPRDVIQRGMQLGRAQGMPDTLTFANQHSNEINDH